MDVANCQESDEDADLSGEEEYHETEQQQHSLDAEHEETYFNAQGQDITEFPFTPPVSNSRLVRRERQGRSGKKQQTYKEYKNVKAMDKQRKPPRAFVNVIKERYLEGNALFSGLTSVDSDADLERENLMKAKDKKQKDRDEKQKRISTTRQHDRFVKRHSEDMSGRDIADTAPMEIVTPVVPVKLEGSGRFLSLAASAKVLPISPVSADRTERRQPSVTKVVCPKERLSFYKTFAALINMGSHGKKQKESKEKERFFTQRQKSFDEKLFHKYIWLGLQAWLNGCQPVDQEQKIQIEREKVPKVLEEVMTFKVTLPQSVLGFKIGEQSIPEMTDMTPDVMYNRISSCSVDTESSRTDISETYHTMRLNSEIFDQQQEAIKQVYALLQKLDRCEQLFPTSAAFAQEYVLYKEPLFVKRLEALYLWLNVTQDLCEKVKLLGKVLNIQNVQGADWPFLEFESPRFQEITYGRELSQLHRTSIPEIRSSYEGGEECFEQENGSSDGEDNSGGGEKGISDKRVSFKVESERRASLTGYASPKRDSSPSNMLGSPSDASTPLKGPLSSTSLSRASSEASLDDFSRNSVYRNFVDKGLKKVGLSKMLIRLRDILDKSLQRAKRSLEKPRGEFMSYDSVCKVCISPVKLYSI